MELAAVLAVAHSPFARSSSQDFDCGAIWISWASVSEISSVANEQGVSAAVAEKASDRTSDAVRIECMVFSCTGSIT